MKRIPVIALFFGGLLLSACGKSKLSEMPDFDLEQKYAYCLDNEPTAPGKATACENLRKECEHRAQAGNYVCRTY